MKTIIYLSILTISVLCQAQRVDVMIVGTVHHFNDEFKSLQDFEGIKKDIISYNPDIICIEAIPISDTLSLKEISPNTMKRADSLRIALNEGRYDSLATCAQMLGAQRFASYDFWNAYYAWDSAGIGKLHAGPFAKYHRSLKNSEYGNIVFPAARSLGITEFQNIDYRVGEKEFLTNNNIVLKKLLFKLKIKPIASYMKTQKRYKKEHEAGTLMDFVNGEEFQNSFSQLIDELPTKLKKLPEAKFVKESWHHRNKIMADRIDEAAQRVEAGKVLVTVGAAHVYHLKLYLEKLGYDVTTYGDFLNTNKQNK